MYHPHLSPVFCCSFFFPLKKAVVAENSASFISCYNTKFYKKKVYMISQKTHSFCITPTKKQTKEKKVQFFHTIQTMATFFWGGGSRWIIKLELHLRWNWKPLMALGVYCVQTYEVRSGTELVKTTGGGLQIDMPIVFTAI